MLTAEVDTGHYIKKAVDKWHYIYIKRKKRKKKKENKSLKIN
jgi:hypothetical protein